MIARPLTWGALLVGLGLTVPALAAGPRVDASAQLSCFQDDAFPSRVREQIGKAQSQAWTLRLRQTGSSALVLTLLRKGKKIGVRRFASLPETCADQHRLIATVTSLAVEHWQSTQGNTKKKGPRKRKRKRRTRPKPENTDSAVPSEPEASTETSAPASSETPAQEASSSVEASPASPSRETKSATSPRPSTNPPPRKKKTGPRTQENTGPDAARELARAQARQARQRAKKTPRPPFSLGGGLGLGASYGVAANLGPQLQGWLSARRPRVSMRGGLRFAYGVPRTLGPAKLHSGVAALDLQLCLRPGRSPSGAMEFWACLGGMAGMVWAGGKGSDNDAQGVSPIAAPTLSVELPLANKGKERFALGLAGGVNLLRTRFEIRSSRENEPLLHSYTAPPFHVGLSFRWRR